MIKFFRKIRQNAIMNNSTSKSSGKVSKYLLYAVGEIALVVIGILIALQINNWNESRKNRIVEKEVLHNMLESLETNIEKQKSYIEANQYCDFASNIIINVIDENLANHDSLSKYFGWALSIKEPSSLVSSVGHESLKQEGVEMIRNKELKKEIITLIEETKQVIVLRLDRMMSYHTELVKLRQQYFLRLKNFDFTPFNFEKLVQDKCFYSWLKTVKFTRGRVTNSVEDSLLEIKEFFNFSRMN
jgi:hypothetical protein